MLVFESVYWLNKAKRACDEDDYLPAIRRANTPTVLFAITDAETTSEIIEYIFKPYGMPDVYAIDCYMIEK